MVKFVHEENALALGFRTGFHDPHDIGVAAEFFYENCIVSRENIGVGDDVHIDIIPLFILFSNRVILFFHILAVALDILAHQILSCEFVMVREMIQ